MKKTMKLFFVGLFMITSVNVATAQSYKMGIGAVVGMMNGVSFKAFFSENFALKADLAYKYTIAATNVDGMHFYGGANTFELNPNFIYQKNITSFGVGNLDWYAGGGVSIGMAFAHYGYVYGSAIAGKFGTNAIGGVELKFNFPLAIDFDFRPGYGLTFRNGTGSYFDWAITASARYCF